MGVMKALRYIYILFFISAFPFPQCALSADQAVSHDIAIRGDAEFQRRVGEALKLLRNKVPKVYADIARYIGAIEQSDRSGMRAWEKPPVFQMSSKTLSHSKTWAASCIAHESYHSKLYHDYLSRHGSSVPDNVWADKEAELKCVKFQIGVAKKLNAPRREISYLQSLDGSHGDVDQDGKLDAEDYEKRNW